MFEIRRRIKTFNLGMFNYQDIKLLKINLGIKRKRYIKNKCMLSAMLSSDVEWYHI